MREGRRGEVRDVGWVLVFPGGWFLGSGDWHWIGDSGEEVREGQDVVGCDGGGGGVRGVGVEKGVQPVGVNLKGRFVGWVVDRCIPIYFSVLSGYFGAATPAGG